MKTPKLTGIQYAALPYRLQGRRVEVMLITSRRTRRWIIPKGWPISGLKPQETAVTEAAEEAGILGEIGDRPVGSYRYLKRVKTDDTMVVQVIVFPLRVSANSAAFKEQDQRLCRWFGYREAASLVAEPSLQHLIRDFAGAQTSNRLIRALHTYRAWRFSGHRPPWRW